MRDKLITFSSENNSITKKDICNQIIHMISSSTGCAVVLITYSWRENDYNISYIDLIKLDWFYVFIYGFIGYNIRDTYKISFTSICSKKNQTIKNINFFLLVLYIYLFLKCPLIMNKVNYQNN